MQCLSKASQLYVHYLIALSLIANVITSSTTRPSSNKMSHTLMASGSKPSQARPSKFTARLPPPGAYHTLTISPRSLDRQSHRHLPRICQRRCRLRHIPRRRRLPLLPPNHCAPTRPHATQMVPIGDGQPRGPRQIDNMGKWEANG